MTRLCTSLFPLRKKRKELIIQNTKLLLRMTISNFNKTWTNTNLLQFARIFDFTLQFFKALSRRQVNNKVKEYTSHLYFIFSIIIKSTLLYPVSENALRSWWQQPLEKSWNLQCQNGAMTHISRKTKSRRQHALFL